MELVDTLAAVEDVVARSAVEEVETGAAVEGIGAVAAIEMVHEAAAAVEGVVAAQTVHIVVACGAHDGFAVPGAALDRHVLILLPAEAAATSDIAIRTSCSVSR